MRRWHRTRERLQVNLTAARRLARVGWKLILRRSPERVGIWWNRQDELILLVSSIMFLAVGSYWWMQQIHPPPPLRSVIQRDLFCLDVNTADELEWSQLEGIGPELSRRIVEYRDQFGPFESPRDLLKVKGIGPRKLERILPWLQGDH